jgi:hypothetical protein
MNKKSSLTAAFSLGLLATLGGSALAEGADDPWVETVPLPAEMGLYWNVLFSGDGSTVGAYGDGLESQVVYLHDGISWKLIRRESGLVAPPGTMAVGLSDDGASLLMSEYNDVSVYHEGATTVLPKRWRNAQGAYLSGDSLFRGAISGDGSVVGIGLSPNENEYSMDALLWAGGSELLNLNRDRVNDGTEYLVVDLNQNGQVIAGLAIRGRSLNDIEHFTVQAPWVYQNGMLVDIPPLNLGYEHTTHLAGVSGNGEAVIGSSQGVWAGEDNQWLFGENHAWIWTVTTGTIEIEDPSVFESVNVMDITDDAQTVLGWGFNLNGQREWFLWTAQGGFVMLNDLLTHYKIPIDIDSGSYWLTQISGDGSKLMGSAQIDGEGYAIIVTIPTRGGVLSAFDR